MILIRGVSWGDSEKQWALELTMMMTSSVPPLPSHYHRASWVAVGPTRVAAARYKNSCTVYVVVRCWRSDKAQCICFVECDYTRFRYVKLPLNVSVTSVNLTLSLCATLLLQYCPVCNDDDDNNNNNNDFICCMQKHWSIKTLLVPQVRRGTFGTCAFSVARPTVWNSLPDCLRDPAVDSEQFRRDLKTYLFAGHSRR